MQQRSYTVWLCSENRIASFHKIAGYESRSFTCYEYFMGFLCGLQEQGYRFQ